MILSLKFSKVFLALALFWFCTGSVAAQIVQKFGDNSNSIHHQAVIELESTTKGFLLPRMTKNQRDLISNPPEGLMLWCTDCSLTNGSEIVVWIKDSWTGLLISSLGNKNILVGNADGKAQGVNFSGDITISNTGVSAIGTSKVVSSMIADGTLIATDIADNAVITSKIYDANITNTKLDKTNIPLSGFAAAAAAVALGNNKLTGVAEPTDSDDATTKNYVDNGLAAINTLTDGKVYLGNSSNVATEVTLSGDVTVSDTGVSAISSGVIVNEDVNSNAAIAGTKIAPNFGSQNISTTGNETIGGTLEITGATSVSTFETSGLATLNSAVIINNTTLGGTLGVSGATSLTGVTNTGNLTNIGNATVSGTLGATGETSLTTLVATGDVDFDANLNVDGTLDVTGATVLKNTLNTQGDVDFDANLNVDGTATINNLGISNDLIINGTLDVTGATVLKNTLNGQGDVDFDANLNVDGTATINNLGISNDLIINGTLDVAGATVLKNTLNGQGNVDFDANLNVDGTLFTGNTTVAGTLEVYGAASVGSNLVVRDNATVGGTLGITGETSLTTLFATGAVDFDANLNVDGTLDVTGATILKNTLNSQGDVDFDANLNVDGTLDVTEATVLKNTLNGQGGVDFDANLNVDGTTTLNSTLGVTGVATLSAQPILQTLTPSLPVFTDTNKGLVSNPITGTELVVLSESPTLTGVPLAPTANPLTNTTQIATTAFALSNSDKYYSVSESTPIDTRASSDEVIPGMSLTSELPGTYAVTFNAQYTIDPSDRTSQAAADLLTGYNSLIDLTSTPEIIVAAIPTRTFTPGVYSSGAAGTVAASVEITLKGAGTYIFKFGAALSMGAGVKIILTEGATASNVFWIAEGAIAIGASAKIKGNFISNSGAVDLAAGCILQGKLLAIKSGAISISGCTVTNSGSSSATTWNLISSFAIFSTGGVISNTGGSTISGDIGTKIGSITIATFDSSIVTGNFYTSLVGSALASFSVYQNDVLIANSTRTRSSTINTVDVSLQAIAKVGADENIDIRWNCDSGKITLNSRILTLINVR